MKQRKIILILSIFLVLIIGGLVIFYVINYRQSPQKDKYKNRLQTANKYIQEERWEDAIGVYLEIIANNDEDVEAYLTLAQIYLYNNMMDEARELLLRGIEKTQSQKLIDLYSQYFENTVSEHLDELTKDEGGLEINTTLLKQISTFTLGDYIKKYSSPVYTPYTDGCDVEHRNLQDVVFSYYNTDENQTIIDSNTHQPKEDKMPWKATVNDISILFTSSNEVIKYEELQGLSLIGLRITSGDGNRFKIVLFKACNCTVRIQCDNEGNIAKDAWNEIVPDEANVSTDTKIMTVEGSIISATTGRGISRATLLVRERGKKSGTPIERVEVDSNGQYQISVEQGEYTAEVQCEGFLTEFFDFEVDKWGEISNKQFVLSEVLQEGQIRIILEWGEYPRDLDSHLEGTTSDNRRIHVFFRNMSDSAVNLDVDDISSYGPETITINDIGGNYKYYVYDFTQSGNIGASEAVVKVYLPGENSPRVYNVPAITGNTWEVFEIRNGSIVDY